MPMSLKGMLISVIALLFIIGCAPVISKETLKDVDKSVHPEDIVKNPEGFAGKKVVIGGTILGVENLENRTYVEILQEGLNYRLKPVDPDESAGRFLVSFDGFKDPAVFSKGRGLTVAGVVGGLEERKIGKSRYRYPLINVTEHYLWPERAYSSEPSVGIGLGFGYTHID